MKKSEALLNSQKVDILVKNYNIRLNFKNGITGQKTPTKDVDLFTILDEVKQEIDMNNHDWLDNDNYSVDTNFLISNLKFDKETGRIKSIEFLSTKEYIRDLY